MINFPYGAYLDELILQMRRNTHIGKTIASYLQAQGFELFSLFTLIMPGTYDWKEHDKPKSDWCRHGPWVRERKNRIAVTGHKHTWLYLFLYHHHGWSEISSFLGQLERSWWHTFICHDYAFSDPSLAHTYNTLVTATITHRLIKRFLFTTNTSSQSIYWKGTITDHSCGRSVTSC